MAFPDASVAMMLQALLATHKERDELYAAELRERDERNAAELRALVERMDQRERDERHAAELRERDKRHAAELRECDERYAAELRALAERMDQVTTLLQSSSVSASQLGLQCEQHLEALHAISLLEATPGAAAVLTLAEQAELSALSALPKAQGGAEAGIVRFITPFIAALRIPQPAAGGGGCMLPLHRPCSSTARSTSGWCIQQRCTARTCASSLTFFSRGSHLCCPAATRRGRR